MKRAHVLLFIYCTVMLWPLSSWSLQTGAEQTARYFPLLKNKRVALIVNQSSVVGEQHLVDVLHAENVQIDTILAPEHGFRQLADAGEHVDDTVDAQSGIAVLSLYGARKQPPAELMQRIDVLVFDIQDVGTRFYTFVSTLHYALEACADANKQLVVLDRPNPNADYVDGPVLDLSLQSFVGMHPIPVVYGLTLGELATMIVGEKWLRSSGQCDLRVIPVAGYQRSQPIELKQAPSPNLRNAHAIRWYPSLVFFEATPLSVGRGTAFPFEVIGWTKKSAGNFEFIPRSVPGAKQPVLMDQILYGEDLRQTPAPHFSLQPLIRWQRYFAADAQTLFTAPAFMDKLMGVRYVREMIEQGASEDAIRRRWQSELHHYMKLRERYLIYPN